MRRPKPLSRRAQDKLDGFEMGMRLWDTAPDERRLEKRFTIDFHISLCHLPRKWREDEYGRGYWHTPVGDLITFGDLRAALRRMYEDMTDEDDGPATASGPQSA